MQQRFLFVLLVLWCGAALGVRAQSNHYYSDFRPWHFGGTVGLNFASARIQSDTRFGPVANPDDPTNPLIQVAPRAGTGVNLGIIFNLKLARVLDLRFIPAASLTQRNYDFVFKNGQIRQRTTEAVWVELPLYLKYKSNVYRNVRVYVLNGPKLNFNIGSLEFVRSNPDQVAVKPLDLTWNFAFGINLYGDHVKLTPEIGYSFGFLNIYQRRDTDIPGAITSLTTGMFTLSLHFE